MNIVERARQLRKIIELSAQSLDDEMAITSIELFPEWKTETAYSTGEKIKYNNVLYKCLQSHTSQDTWTPTEAPSLFAKVLIPDPEVIPEWEQPGSTNPYMKGDKVRYKGEVYESLIDNNIWSPEAYPAGWQLIESETWTDEAF